MKKRPIQAGWEAYRKVVVPADAGEAQLNETRQAFFAGAAVLLQGIMGALSPGPDESEGDMRLMSDIQDELTDFGQQLDKGVLGKVSH